MADATPKTIVLKHYEHCLQVEHTAAGTITPGDLVALNSAGLVVRNPTATDPAPEKTWAIEDDAQGRGIDDNYDATTYKNVRIVVASPGTHLWANIAVPAAIVIGDKFESAGNGQLRERTTGAVVAVALEAKTASSPTAGPIRCRVRTV